MSVCIAEDLTSQQLLGLCNGPSNPVWYLLNTPGLITGQHWIVASGGVPGGCHRVPSGTGHRDCHSPCHTLRQAERCLHLKQPARLAQWRMVCKIQLLRLQAGGCSDRAAIGTLQWLASKYCAMVCQKQASAWG